jgi:N-acetylglucosamine-6-sulfatase
MPPVAIFIAALASAADVNGSAPRPNIVLFLTDDQDQMLGGSFPPLSGTPMPKTQRLLADEGVTATNFFVHTPICCPSRSELLAGRYLHNLKVKPDAEPKPAHGGNCMHINETKVNNFTFAAYLHEAGYAVGLFGKFLNSVPDMPRGWGIPPDGYDAWLANGGGAYFSPSFGVKNLKPFWPVEDGDKVTFEGNYTTAVVGNISSAWIRHVHATEPDKPFFAYVAPKAAHEPFNPAPWYADHWDEAWPAHEPRPEGVWNASFAARINHHGNIKTQPMLTPEAATVISGVFRNRTCHGAKPGSSAAAAPHQGPRSSPC